MGEPLLEPLSILSRVSLASLLGAGCTRL